MIVLDVAQAALYCGATEEMRARPLFAELANGEEDRDDERADDGGEEDDAEYDSAKDKGLLLLKGHALVDHLEFGQDRESVVDTAKKEDHE